MNYKQFLWDSFFAFQIIIAWKIFAHRPIHYGRGNLFFILRKSGNFTETVTSRVLFILKSLFPSDFFFSCLEKFILCIVVCWRYLLLLFQFHILQLFFFFFLYVHRARICALLFVSLLFRCCHIQRQHNRNIYHHKFFQTIPTNKVGKTIAEHGIQGKQMRGCSQQVQRQDKAKRNIGYQQNWRNKNTINKFQKEYNQRMSWEK